MNPEKKSWFSRHKILTALLVIVGLGIVITLATGNNDNETAEPTAAAEQVESTNSESTDSDATENGEEAPEDAAEGEKPADDKDGEQAAFQIGDTVAEGDLEVVVQSIEESTSDMGLLIDAPAGKYIIVKMSVTNPGDKAVTFSSNNQKLIDTQGREHSESNNSLWLDDSLSFKEINPGMTIEGSILFDIPADAEPDQLIVADSMFSSGTPVDLK